MDKTDNIAKTEQASKICKITFAVCLSVSIILLVWGFCTPPQGKIDGSVLKAVGELFAFAALAVGGNAITLGYNCSFNTFGNNCQDNTFGNGCEDNTFGNRCSFNTFGASKNSPKHYYKYNYLSDGVQYCNVDNTETSSYGNQVQFYEVGGMRGTDSNPVQISATRNNQYTTTVQKNSSGEIKQFCLADLVQ